MPDVVTATTAMLALMTPATMEYASKRRKAAMTAMPALTIAVTRLQDVSMQITQRHVTMATPALKVILVPVDPVKEQQ